MRNYARGESVEQDLSEILDEKFPEADLDNLFSTGHNNLSPRTEQTTYTGKGICNITVKPRGNLLDDSTDKNDAVYYKAAWEPSFKNPVQKYEIEDSSDEELVEKDTRDRINLAGRNLEAIPNSIASNAKDVKVLTLTNNQMKLFEQLSAFISLETLVLDKNNLKTLKGLPTIKTLKTLWLNNNKIDNFEMLLVHVKMSFPNLRYLSLLRNPINPAVYFGTENEKPYSRFRRRILQELPDLKVIDTKTVTEEEREDARRQPKFLVAFPMDAEEITEDEPSRKETYVEEKVEPAAFIGRGRIKYDEAESEGNRFITNIEL